jgi:hypothetical protein
MYQMTKIEKDQEEAKDTKTGPSSFFRTDRV